MKKSPKITRTTFVTCLAFCASLTVTPVDALEISVYKSCIYFNSEFPFGVASSAKMAVSAKRSGFSKPIVKANVYKANKKLDVSKIGTVCPVTTSGSVRQTTSWGYVTAWGIKGPKKVTCVNVPVEIEIRNNTRLNMWGVQLAVMDDFDNFYGLTEFDWFEDFEDGSSSLGRPVANGKYTLGVRVCGNARKPQQTNSEQSILSPYVAGEDYWLVATDPVWETLYAAPKVLFK